MSGRKNQFQIGNPGGPGRPKRQTEESYLRVLMGACDLDKWQLICEKAVESALNGDAKARDWLARYVVGTPETRALKPFEVVVGDLLMTDAALDKAAEQLVRPLVSMQPFILHDEEEENELKAKAKQAILEAEMQSVG